MVEPHSAANNIVPLPLSDVHPVVIGRRPASRGFEGARVSPRTDVALRRGIGEFQAGAGRVREPCFAIREGIC
jgi:hypothetical protein